MKKISNDLYKISRTVNKIASVVNDLETMSTCKPQKIIKRAKRKTVGRMLNKINKKIINNLL